ncbi:BAK1-interacting receptor-like kinase 1 [Prunus dulcis]|uniref:BAK1-interacting receptor-like kinase 1 n=1 Tax=Prunus dulcis TaxID=3755 RepID=A0A4Y1S1R5_PRUDU|nr:BAK1-interacting receptor-like kinase 1 [Prunus dulcis]
MAIKHSEEYSKQPNPPSRPELQITHNELLLRSPSSIQSDSVPTFKVILMAFLIPVLLSKRNLDMFVSSALWLLLLSCSFSFGVESDINCLKSIKASLEDTLGYLNSSWDFNNNTEGFICNFLGIECWHPHESKVLNIKLSDLGLKGQFPRGVENCTSLTGLDLSGNMLSGPLPHDIDKILTWVTSLDLSSNSFSGLIPATFSNCSYMNVLKLDNNQFSGNIPAEVNQLTRLRTFSVANNLLSGQVPPFGENIASIRRDSYANNPGLCGYPLKPCPSISQKKSLNVVRVFKSNGVTMVAAADELQQPRVSLFGHVLEHS